MKITKIECIPLVYPYDKPIYDAIFKAARRQALLVKVHTDDGLVGIGEAASFGGPMSSTAHVIENEIAPRLIGMDPFTVERIWRKTYYHSYQHARGGIVINGLSGVDIALWDLMGKKLGTPLYKLLGGYKTKAMAYASGGFYAEGKGTKEIAEEFKKYADSGFRAIKMKVGRNFSAMNPLEVMPDPEFRYSVDEDLERVEAVRKAVGREVLIGVDANVAWDLHTALRAGRFFDSQDVNFFEEPLNTDNRQGSAELAAALTAKVAGYETEQRVYGFLPLITGRCVDIVQPDLSWSGGVTECMKIAHLAYAHHLEVAPHCFSSAVLLAVSLHFLCALPNGGMLEFDRNPNGLREEIVKEPFAIDRDGFVHVPEKPGLGIELDEDAIEKYREK